VQTSLEDTKARCVNLFFYNKKTTSNGGKLRHTKRQREKKRGSNTDVFSLPSGRKQNNEMGGGEKEGTYIKTKALHPSHRKTEPTRGFSERIPDLAILTTFEGIPESEPKAAAAWRTAMPSVTSPRDNT
jgi:hypothetical protein